MAAKARASASTVRSKIKTLREETGWSPSGLVALLRGGGNPSKGPDYEREFCTRLSLWWTGGKQDDVFWRSQGSGGRASSRAKRGRATVGQHGDVAATQPIGEPLIDLMTIELKRGYSEYTVQDMLDRADKNAQQEWERFFYQCITSHEEAGSFAWFMVTRRDRRLDWCWFPKYLLSNLRSLGAFATPPRPRVRMMVEVRDSSKVGAWHNVVGTTIDNFFDLVEPDHFHRLAKVA